MTDKELHKLKRLELLEIMLELSDENDKLKEENQRLKEQLENKKIMIEKSGSIAEAALKLSGIFEAAQNAADCYLKNIEEKTEMSDKNFDEENSESGKNDNANNSTVEK